MFGLPDRETFSIEYLIANIATGLLLLGNRLAYAQSQLTSTREPRPALTPQTRPPVKNAQSQLTSTSSGGPKTRGGGLKLK